MIIFYYLYSTYEDGAWYDFNDFDMVNNDDML